MSAELSHPSIVLQEGKQGSSQGNRQKKMSLPGSQSHKGEESLLPSGAVKGVSVHSPPPPSPKSINDRLGNISLLGLKAWMLLLFLRVWLLCIQLSLSDFAKKLPGGLWIAVNVHQEATADATWLNTGDSILLHRHIQPPPPS